MTSTKAQSQQEKLDDALFNATGLGNLELVKQGVKAGGNPATKQNGRHNCLRLATQRAYFHIVRYFVEELGMSLKDDPLIFHYAALGNIKHPTMLAYLKEKGAQLNYCDEKLGTPLTLGMFKGDVDEQFARWMIENGADVTIHCPTGERSSALHKAAEFASPDLVKLILEKGGKVLLDKKDVKGSTPLIIAAEHGREDVCELLLAEGGVDPNQYGHYTALFMACQNAHYGVAKLLVDAGADVNIKDDTHECGRLHLAASNNHIAIMELLLKHGAQVDMRDKRTIDVRFHTVADGGHSLCDTIDVRPPSPNKDATAMHVVCSRGQARMAALLLSLGADLDAKDVDGTTPRDLIKESPILTNAIKNFNIIFDAEKVCNACFKTIDGKKRCSRCRATFYCSGECQAAGTRRLAEAQKDLQTGDVNVRIPKKQQHCQIVE